MIIFYFSLSFALLIYVWKNTNVLVEYYNWLQLSGLKWLDEYNKKNEYGFIENFSAYIAREKDDLFIISLISCPTCLSIWSGIFSIPFTGWKCLAVGYLTLFFYYLLEKINCNK